MSAVRNRGKLHACLSQHKLAFATSWVALCLYLPSLTSDFLRDDHWQIVTNPQVQSWTYLPRLLTTHLWSQSGTEQAIHFYRPLFSVWLLLVNTLVGLSPPWWHFSSIALHALATFIVYQLCKALLEDQIAAVLPALLFAVHPIHVDAVSWVSAGNEILFTVLVLSAMLVLSSANGRLTSARLAWSLALFTAGLFTKETAVAMLPVMLVALHLRVGQIGKQQAVRAACWYSLVTVFYVAVRWSVLHRSGLEEAKHAWGEVLYTTPSVLIFYVKKLLLPIGLAGFYVTPLNSSFTPGEWLLAGGFLIAIGLLAWIAIRYSLLIALAGAITILPLFPALFAVRIYDQGDMTHDRYLYLPSFGLCLLVGLGIKQINDQHKIARVALMTLAAGILSIAGLMTTSQQTFYKNDEVFYQRAIDVDPMNVLAVDYLGDAYLESGQANRAVKQFKRATLLAPNDPNVVFHLAHGLFENHEYAEAEPLLVRASTMPGLESRRQAILLALADTEISLGALSSAEDVLQRLQQLDPRFPSLHRTLAIVFQREGRLTKAQMEYHREFQVSGDIQSERQAFLLGRFLSSSSESDRRLPY